MSKSPRNTALQNLRIRSERASNPTKREIAAANAFYAGASPREVAIPEISKARAAPKPKSPDDSSEHAEQAHAIHWWRYNHMKYGLPMFALYAVPNSAERGNWLANRMKAEGLRAGIPDLVLAKPMGRYAGLYVEMKYGDNTTSAEQDEVMFYLRSVNYRCEVCYTGEAAIQTIRSYLA